jgi:hypothetical protein
MLQPNEDGGLGFHDLYHFNLAMLTKQVWRLICNPDSLCGHILKARYFPDGNILSATCPQGASYTWRNITKGIGFMKKGMIYRLDGDGGHLFLKCKYAKLVWRELMLEDKRECLADAESSKDVFKMIWQWDEKLQVLIVVTLWMLWSPRNETNADESTQAPKITVRLILKHCGYPTIDKVERQSKHSTKQLEKATT